MFRSVEPVRQSCSVPGRIFCVLFTLHVLTIATPFAHGQESGKADGNLVQKPAIRQPQDVGEVALRHLREGNVEQALKVLQPAVDGPSSSESAGVARGSRAKTGTPVAATKSDSLRKVVSNISASTASDAGSRMLASSPAIK